MSSPTLRRALVALAIAASIPACSKAKNEPARPAAEEEDEKELFARMTVEELDAKLASARAGQGKVAVFDNNDRARFDKGHIPGARWVKFDAVKASDLPADKETTLVFYCANEYCTACHSGANAAAKLGYRNVFILPAGIKGWEKAKKPVEQS